MATISSIFSPSNLLHHPTKPIKTSPKLPLQILKPTQFQGFHKLTSSYLTLTPRHSQRLFAVAQEVAADPVSKAARRVYIGNIPRTLDNAVLTKIVEEHGVVEKAEVMYDKYSGRSRRFAFATMMTVEDANAVVEKLNGTEIGGREVKVNITEKPLLQADTSLVQAEESQFIDSPHKVYVGNLAKEVTTDTLKTLFFDREKFLVQKFLGFQGPQNLADLGLFLFPRRRM
ncbi:30S ribosomal protein 2 [Pyrus ussuriensis x Pyrus communis]|uniref:30S ribosomal protein 2 n=1 Tax=Pyrus ussuriensis x Pyrus communis TaxID=2448454 RepID=A0A5N5HPA6_9ROSA|nr:30S ribosomal protein 2 [Pyrus ussuriensis x Pyrus communis]